MQESIGNSQCIYTFLLKDHVQFLLAVSSEKTAWNMGIQFGRKWAISALREMVIK